MLPVLNYYLSPELLPSDSVQANFFHPLTVLPHPPSCALYYTVYLAAFTVPAVHMWRSGIIFSRQNAELCARGVMLVLLCRYKKQRDTSSQSNIFSKPAQRFGLEYQPLAVLPLSSLHAEHCKLVPICFNQFGECENTFNGLCQVWS